MAETFNIFLIVMAMLAAGVYVALHFFEAGYGYLFNPKYGPPVPNKVGWVVMESPVFIAMCVLWLMSGRTWEAGPLALFVLFQAHYLQRAFIFPLLLRGESKMPLGIVVMGMAFNTLNALMQGGWIFYVSPEGYYADWFAKPYIYVGGAMFLAGMAVNLHSDHIIRHLRKPGDTRHYIPRGGSVPIRLVGQLFRRTARMDGLRRSFVVVGRGGIRLVDVRQPRAPCGIALQALRTRVREGIHGAETKKDHTFHLLTYRKMSSLFTPYKLGPVTLRNRTVRSAAFESMGRHFGPTEQLKEYHVSVARGGVGMTTLAYAAVCRSGLSFDKQLWLRPEIVPGLRGITDAVHREGAAAGIQIGHCGNMTHLTTAGQIPIGASTGFNLYAYTPVRGMRKDEIAQVARDFGKAVHTAHDAGFDSVEVHAGHGYLISQFLSPYTNHRKDEYGGTLENRMRFMRMCLTEVMEAAAKTGTAVLVKHNMYDGFKGGIEIPESIAIAREIERFGVDGIVLSGGFVSKAPMAVMRGLIPIYTMSYYSPLWLRYFIRWCGPFMIRQFPFEECYFLEDAKKFRAELKCPLVYVGGLVSREGIDKALDAGFELVQMARALVNDPAFVNKLREGDASTRSGCDHRNYCIARMYSVDMKCCKHCDGLPRRIQEELAKLP